MTAQEIKNLQTQLNAKGANLKIDGIMGPKTQAAMSQFASAPITSTPTTVSNQTIADLQRHLNKYGANLKVDGILGPQTAQIMDTAVSRALSTNPATKNVINQTTGKPFGEESMQEAIARAEADLAPGYNAQEQYDTANVASGLEGAQDQYGQFLNTEAENFQAEKEQQDQNAADQGILFSGSRYQKLNNLSNKYDQRQKDQLTNLGRSVGNTARDYQYKYGDQAASKLSDYYNYGGQNYNANVAGGKVTNKPTLSSVYNPNQYNFAGTIPSANKAQAYSNASLLQKNKANKLVTGGYNTRIQ